MPVRISTNACGLTFISAVALGLLSACGGGGGSGSDDAPTVTGTRLSCTQLLDMKIEVSSIGLPTTGSVITDTRTVTASGAGVSAVGEHCLVSGSIMPIDPWAPNINFQVALPTEWNSKVVMKGGGGFNGSIPNPATNVAVATGFISPLGRGYAVFASDSGHQGASLPNPAAFMSNQESYRNYMGDALKKTRDASLAVVKAFYGTAPLKSYFLGGSTGGREGLQVAGTWPADWDGVVALSPAGPVTTSILGMIGVSRAMAAPGAYSNVAKRGVLYRAALEACDSLDGASDGIISDEKRCGAIFDPSTALLNGTSVRCAGGTDNGDTCLSDAQIAALKAASNPLPLYFSLASGATSAPGYNMLTSDTTNLTYGLGTVAPGFPFSPTMPTISSFADSYVRYGVADDDAFNYLSLDPSNPGVFASRFSSQSALDTRGMDMSGFAAKSGKLLLMHGTSDMLVTPRSSEQYFQQWQAKQGTGNVDSFARFYLIPGFGHGQGTTFNASWDQLTALENWVENGIDPKGNQIITDTSSTPTRTRPLCIYPTWAKYRGSGDVNSAESFTCAVN